MPHAGTANRLQTGCRQRGHAPCRRGHAPCRRRHRSRCNPHPDWQSTTASGIRLAPPLPHPSDAARRRSIPIELHLLLSQPLLDDVDSLAMQELLHARLGPGVDDVCRGSTASVVLGIQGQKLSMSMRPAMEASVVTTRESVDGLSTEPRAHEAKCGGVRAKSTRSQDCRLA